MNSSPLEAQYSLVLKSLFSFFSRNCRPTNFRIVPITTSGHNIDHVLQDENAGSVYAGKGSVEKNWTLSWDISAFTAKVPG